jgi:hypothetical protein
MNSTFTWLDHSERDRRRMLDVIDRFRESEARDELGFGVVQNTFADMLFPGTSTIQTRARYFLFVPWIYRYLEGKRVGSNRVWRRARDMEVRLISTLLASDDKQGTIGARSRANLQQMPSSIYWQGLREWGICQFPGSQDQYHRSLDAYYDALPRSRARTDDGDPLDDGISHNWHPGLPSPTGDFLYNSSFRLTQPEASYLSERIQTSHPDSLLAVLVGLDKMSDWVDFPWEHPSYSMFPERIQRQLRHARAFSEAVYGAQLLYNLMLSEARAMDESVEERSKSLRDWAALVEESDALAGWDRNDFWELILYEGANISVQTRSFIDCWLDIALAPGSASGVASDSKARILITDRELARKRAQARLSNRRALELWNGASGLYRLSYRWGSAHLVLSDIADVLEQGEHA